MAAAKTEGVRTAYMEGRSIAALARDHGVSRGAIRTAVADLMPDHAAIEEDVPAPELPVALDMPGKVADCLRVSALPAVHVALLARCRPLDGGHGVPTVPAQRKARREYENRVRTLTPTGP